MKKASPAPILMALLAAVLFGASAPLSKVLLGEIEPIPLAAFLYIGSGVGSWLMSAAQNAHYRGRAVEAQLSRKDIPWLIGAVLTGGVGAPILLMLGLNHAPASTASLLLNFESVATTLIAWLVFREAVDKRILWAVGLITMGSIILSRTAGNIGFSTGALGILGACLLWGVDNNLTRHISTKNPLVIVGIKGLGAGGFSLLLSFVLRKPMPDLGMIGIAMLVGSICYGVSIQLFIVALRNLGAARTSALFGTAPFAGTTLSIVFLKERPQTQFWAALPFMLAGTWMMLSEKHEHQHNHEEMEHEHAHTHTDTHHIHGHPIEDMLVNARHTHIHRHSEVPHNHPHAPDPHHRHAHRG
jgi:drug/metabolite transporter (DMT)-like permease